MLSIRSILLLGFPLVSLCLAQPEPTPSPSLDNIEEPTLQELVDWLPEESVKSALQDHLEKYREGVFEHGKKAIEVIHNESPALATKLVDHALLKEIQRQDLRKRQTTADNATTTTSTTTSSTDTDTETTTTTSTTTSSDSGSGSGGGGSGSSDNNDNGATTTTTTSTTSTGVLVPVQTTSTDNAGNTVVQTTTALQSTAQTTVQVTKTTVDSAGSTVESVVNAPATVITSTNQQGDTVVATSTLETAAVGAGGAVVTQQTVTDGAGNAVVLSGTSGQVITTTDAAGRTVVTTFQPTGARHVSELVIKTTQLPNGRQSTYTSYARVGGQTAVVQGAGDNSGGSSTGKPGLQSDVAAPTGRYAGQVAAVLGGAVAFAALM